MWVPVATAARRLSARRCARVTDSDGAEILGCTREAFRQLVSRARRSMRQVLINPANPCRCGRQIASTSPPLRSWGTDDLQSRFPNLLTAA
jgi:hypothetical protein